LLLFPSALLFYRHVIVLPAIEAPLKFHYRIAIIGKELTCLGSQMAHLRITIHYIRFVAIEPFQPLPLGPWNIDRTGNMPLVEIFRSPNIDNCDFRTCERARGWNR
jgi:hypothetical protein